MKIRELLSDETKWCKNDVAQDKDGSAISATSDDACKWCLVGAIDKCYTDSTEDIWLKIYKYLNMSIGKFNDSHNFEDIKNLVEELDI